MNSTFCDEFSLISISINGAEAGGRIGTIGMMLMMIMQSARRKDSQREGAAEHTKHTKKHEAVRVSALRTSILRGVLRLLL